MALHGLDVPEDPPPPVRPAATGAVTPAPARPEWQALRYAVTDDSTRAAVRRKLKRIDALNLHQATWALRSDEASRALGPRIVEEIHEAGGSATIEAVPDSSADHLSLNSMLDRACERLWDDFLNHADRYRANRPPTDAALADRVVALRPLLDTFGAAVRRDIVGTTALARAEAYLDEFANELATTEEGEHWCRAQKRVRHTIDVAGGWALSSGGVALIVHPRPRFDPLVERGFVQFEARTLRPSPSRAALRGGTFRVVADLGAEEAALEAIERRLQLFEATLL